MRQVVTGLASLVAGAVTVVVMTYALSGRVDRENASTITCGVAVMLIVSVAMLLSKLWK
jgi:hypothetical protein